MGAVPDTSTWSPIRIARLKPYPSSYGEADRARERGTGETVEGPRYRQAMDNGFDTPTMTVEEARERMAAGARLIDVREQVEWDEARVPGSELCPMSTIDNWYTDLHPDEELLIFCRTGNRSGKVVEALIRRAGFTNAVNVAGGIVSWAESGLPIERGERAS